MSTSHEDLKRDLEDQAVDKLLEETAGGMKPPDVAEKVAVALRADREPLAATAERESIGEQTQSWRKYAVAAAVLVSTGLAATIYWPSKTDPPGPQVVMTKPSSTMTEAELTELAARLSLPADELSSLPADKTFGDRDDGIVMDMPVVDHSVETKPMSVSGLESRLNTTGKPQKSLDNNLRDARRSLHYIQTEREKLKAQPSSIPHSRVERLRKDEERIREYITRVESTRDGQTAVSGESEGEKKPEAPGAEVVTGKTVATGVIVTLEAARKTAEKRPQVARELLERQKQTVIRDHRLSEKDREKLVKQLNEGLVDPAKIPPQPQEPAADGKQQKLQEELVALEEKKTKLLRTREDTLRKLKEVDKEQPQFAELRNGLLKVEVELRDLPAQRPALDGGEGPENRGDNFERIIENEFLAVDQAPLSTFSIDVDTASYGICRSDLMNNRLPQPDAVRIEEFLNYFHYDYAPPQDDKPFATHAEVATCPWNGDHRLLRIGLKGREIDREDLPANNLVFLIDVSGSMSSVNKLPLVQQSLELLAEAMSEKDRIAIVVYAGASGLVLKSTRCDRDKVRSDILPALMRLKSGGSTNGGAGIKLAYQVAQENFLQEGNNRVILCTDGDFNVGITGEGALERLAEEKAKTGVFLSVYGFGRGNLQDKMLEKISGVGNGTYGYIDGMSEARKLFVDELAGSLTTIAKDVKIQVEFNPAQVAAYRLIGYENRMLAAQDFNDDTKDAGEIGVGHTVTALYEVIPAGKPVDVPEVDELKYQRPKKLTKAAKSGEMLTLKLRYKQPDGDKSQLLEFPVTDKGQRFGEASGDFRFASAVAAYGMLLRNSQYSGNSTMGSVLEIAEASKGKDSEYRDEFIELVRKARLILGR